MRVLAVTAMLLSLCSRAEPKRGPLRTAPAPAAAEVAYEHGMKKGWMDFGWSPRKKNPGGPELHDLKDYGGWILAREQPLLAAKAGGLTFTYKAPADFGDFLELKLDKPGTSGSAWEKVRVASQHKRALEGGAFEVFIPMSELNPKQLPFERIVFFAFKPVPSTWVAIDDVALTIPGATEAVVRPAGKPMRMAIDCKKRQHQISPLIYGVAFYPMWEYRDDHHWDLKPAARRWGGNHSTRYNYQLGEAWNAGMDWYFRNLTYTGQPGWTWERFIETEAQRGVQSTVVLPMMGWVAKDTTSKGFPTADFPDQQAAEKEHGAGNGRGKDGKWLAPGPPTVTSVAADPLFVAKWAKLIDEKSQKLKTKTTFILDNEPALWDSTHHDVHPEPVGYDELWSRTKAYASAVKKAVPGAIIQGPAEWGWSNYLYSQKDLKSGGPTLRPDRRMHGDVPLIPWYLQKVAEYEKQNKVRLVDLLDLHFYPQAEGVGTGEHGDTSAEGAARRIRSTRALWDPTYKDESWIDDTVMLIPRMKKWVSENAPGLGTSIGEWNFGAEQHISGGLAVAEALGRFGEQNLTSAYYWIYPADGSAAYWAFRAFRNYDGSGGQFQEWSLAASAPAGASLFASASADGKRVVAVALNLDPKAPLLADVALEGCGEATARRFFTYQAGSTRLESQAADKGPLRLDPYSFSVVEWSFK